MSRFKTVIDKRGKAIRVEVLNPPAGTIVKPKWERRYVQVPWDWVKQLRKAKRLSTVHLAHEILYEHWLHGGRAFPLSNKKVSWLSRRTKWNGLTELEALDLVTIKRKPRRSPWITCHQAKI
jgi:hypothetical protein